MVETQPQKRQDAAAVPGQKMAPMTGDYNKLNASQSTVWKHAQPLFKKALDELLVVNDGRASSSSSSPSSSTFRVADMGCATGGNSIAPLRYVVSTIATNQHTKAIGTALASEAVTTTKTATTTVVECFLCDLPQNAWTEVSTTVTREALLQNQDDASKTITTNVVHPFVYMVGRTFYDSCVPQTNSFDLSYSFVAAHWMKSHPVDFTTGLYATDPLHNTDPRCLQLWKEAGALDFTDFIHARHVELRVGGFFVGVFACPKRSNGDYPWSQVGRPIYDALLKKVQSPDVLASCILPVCWRTEEDVRNGFDLDQWTIHAIEFHETKDPVRESYERNELTAIQYGRSAIDSFKAVCHRTCLEALSQNVPGGIDEANRLLEEAYDDAVEVVASDPNKYNLDVSFWYVLAEKK